MVYQQFSHLISLFKVQTKRIGHHRSQPMKTMSSRQLLTRFLTSPQRVERLHLISPPAAGTLSLVRDTPETQEESYPVSQPFPSKAVESSLDKQTLSIQEIKDIAVTSLHPPVSELSLDMTLPVLAQRAGLLAAYDAHGQPSAVVSQCTVVVDDVVTFDSVAAMKSATVLAGVQGRTVASAAGWEISGDDPTGGETYNVVTLAQYQSITGNTTVDETTNFVLFNGTVALAAKPSNEWESPTPATQTSATTFTVETAKTSTFEKGRRVELTGGADEFIDGPVCLQRLSKSKLDDYRDRFIYNYMVFAKKKYPDNWEEKLLAGARNYIV